MRAIAGYLRDFLRGHFHLGLYLTLSGLLALLYWHNYALDFKRELFGACRGRWYETFVYLLYYLIPYYGTALLAAALTRKSAYLRRPGFWLVSGGMLITLALNRTSLGLPPYILDLFEWNRHAEYFAHLCLVNFLRLTTVLIPLWLWWRLADREQPTFYGLSFAAWKPKPYLRILLLVAPLIIWASFQSAFLATYPIYRPGPVERVMGWSAWISYPLHELSYAMRFIGVELFFRGFMVLGMMRWMGRSALLPMVSLYAVWHFAKPFPEALASAFGAYILGVIPLYSRNIMGGVLVHIGIALLMNFAALIQLALR